MAEASGDSESRALLQNGEADLERGEKDTSKDAGTTQRGSLPKKGKKAKQGPGVLLFVDLLSLHKAAFEANSKLERDAAYQRLTPVVREVLRRKSAGEGQYDDDPDAANAAKKLLVWKWCLELSSTVDSNQTSGDTDAADCDSVISSWREGTQANHLEMLKKAWCRKELQETMFIWFLPQLGQARKRKLLDALCVKVPSKLLGQRTYQYRDTLCDVKLAHCEPWDGTDLSDLRTDELGGTLDGLADADPDPPLELRYERYKSRVDVFYTEVQGVIVDGQRDPSPLALIRWIEALNECCDDGDLMYETPFGQALSESSWDIAYPVFMLDIILMCVFQLLMSWYLAPVSHRVYRLKNKKGNDCVLSLPALYIIIPFGLRGAFTFLFEMLATNLYCDGGKCVSPWKYMNASAVVAFVVEAWSVWFSCCLVYCYIYQGGNFPPWRERDGEDTCPPWWAKVKIDPGSEWAESYLVQHPFHLSSLIFSKWVLLMLKVMNVRGIVDRLHPAWMAIKSKDSVAFLVYLIFLSCGTALAYYALPIVDLKGDHSWEPYVMAFERTTRLDLLGEIENDELSGEASLTDKQDSEKLRIVGTYRWCLQMFTLACSILFPVIALNLYVGLLSGAYNEAKDHIVHNRGLLHATTASKALLRRRMFSRMNRGVCAKMLYRIFGSVFGSAWSTETLKRSREDPPPEDTLEGTWIVLPRHTAIDVEGPGDWDTAEDEQRRDANPHGDIESLVANIKQVETQLMRRSSSSLRA